MRESRDTYIVRPDTARFFCGGFDELDCFEAGVIDGFLRAARVDFLFSAI